MKNSECAPGVESNNGESAQPFIAMVVALTIMTQPIKQKLLNYFVRL
jgi:hypothetical protein